MLLITFKNNCDFENHEETVLCDFLSIMASNLFYTFIVHKNIHDMTKKGKEAKYRRVLFKKRGYK